jgi:hypothetical protein
VSDAAPLGRFYARKIDGPPSRKEMPVRVPRLLWMFSLALAACSGDPSGPAREVGVRIAEVRANPAVPGGDVTFRVRNEGSAPVYLSSCGTGAAAAVDRWEDGRWVPVSPEWCALTAVFPPVELRPGEEIDAVQPVDRDGRLRLRLGIASRPDGRPDWSSAGAEFTIP